MAGTELSKAPFVVMIVDDSPVVRSALRRLVEEGGQARIVGEAGDGRAGVAAVRDAASAGRPVEVVLLDVEMPVMDGLEALAQIVRIDPPPRVIMISSLTRRGAVTTLKALGAGAADYICKPSSRDAMAQGSFRQELLQRIVTLGTAVRAQRDTRATRRTGHATGHATRLPEGAAPGRIPIRDRTAGRYRMGTDADVAALAIGSSTGGPQALLRVLGELCRSTPPTFPIFITQHMPPTFTTVLAEHIGRESGWPCHEPTDGEPVRAGTIYIAPGGRHMLARPSAAGATLVLDDGPPENYCRPSVDPMLRSLVPVYGHRLCALILTGMGRDGLEGCRAVEAAGGRVLAQDEASSVVWGMPGAVTRAGLAQATLPLGSLAGAIGDLFKRRAA